MKWPSVNPAVIFPVALLAVFLPAAPAAGYMSALVEFDYNTSRTVQKDATGSSQTSKNTGFLQRYYLDLNRDIFPTLTFRAGYVFERDLQKTQTDDLEMKRTLIRMSPSAELGFRNPFVGATVGYNEITAKTENRGNPTQTMVQENWTASLGLTRRENLPTFNVMYTRSHAFDKEHAVTDALTEQVLVSSRFQPVKPLEVRYSGTWSENQDNLHAVDTDSVLQSGRLSYNDTFFRNRARVYSNYNISTFFSETRVTGSGSGEVIQPIVPFAGLAGPGPAGTDNPPETPQLDTLTSRTELIDGKTDAGSINIGYSALVTAPRNIGLDLGAETELNTLYISVNQMLPASISNSFSWEIYTASDTADLKNWTLWQTVGAVPFGTFNARFELRFLNVKTRFIKVVVRPLASPVPVPGVDVNNILVTEMQPFIINSIRDLAARNTFRNTSQRIEAGANVKVADFPNLYYDIYYWESKSDLQDISPYMLMNGLTFNQRLSRIFSTSAMARRTDSHDKDGVRLKYEYGASLTATPLPSLFHSVRYTRQTEEVGDELSRSDFVYFNNSATLYRGVSVNFSVSEGNTTSAGRQTKTSAVTSGSTLVPHRTTTINLYHTRSESRSTGGSDTQGSRADKESSSASVAYTPTQAFYLYGSYVTTRTSYAERANIPVSRIQTYTLSWSPLLSGALWFTVLATQVMSSGDDEETTTVSPQLRWIVNPGATVEAGYQMLTKKNILRRSKTDTFFASLKLSF